MRETNLANEAAIEKLKSLVDSIDICMFCTDIAQGTLNAAPMSRQEVDDEGIIWFLANANSDTCRNIERDAKVVLQFAHVGNYSFLKVDGVAQVSRNQQKIDRYWNKMMEGWFEKGKDDPSIRIISVKANNAQYWDTKDNKMITLMKVAASAISGNPLDTGSSGNLEL